MSEKVDLKKSGKNKDRSEDNGEFIGGCYYAPWDF